MSPGLLMLLSFAAAAVAVVGLYSIAADLLFRDRARVARRLDDEFRRTQREQVRSSPLFKNLGRLSAEAASEFARVPVRERLGLFVEQSGVAVSLRQVVGLSAAAAVAAAGLVLLVAPSPPMIAVAAVAAATGPGLYVHLKRNTRLAKMSRQMPDAFDLMARVIRAGQTTEQAVQAVADEFDLPLGAEFGYCAEQQNLGLSPELAFRDLARRAGLLEMRIFVLAVLVQQQTGGNLAEILEKLSHMVRERFRIKGKIQALTAEGRMQAVVLLVLPVLLLGILMLLSPAYAAAVVKYPLMFVVMLAVEAVGAVWIRAIVNFDY